jgi:hypothetical protein
VATESGDDSNQAVNITESWAQFWLWTNQWSALKLPIVTTILVRTTALNIKNTHDIKMPI